jgi:hypothetical protein
MRALLLLTTLALGACDSDVGVIDIAGGGDDTGMGAPGDMPADGGMGEGGEGGPGEPEACATDDECQESCPPDAAECICFEDTCAVACESDDDCPVTPEGDVVSCDVELGVCELPEGPPM